MADNPLLAAMGQKKVPVKSQEQQALLRQIAGNVLSPLASVGNILDLPGSSVRDAWLGHDPWDQWSSRWTVDEGNRTSGRDFLAEQGLASPNDPNKWEWEDVAGFGAEVATDPLSFVSGIGKGAGTALRGIGKADDLFRVGIPFTGLSMGVGKTPAKLLDKAASLGWKAPIPFSGGATLGSAADSLNVARKGLFDYYSGGSFDPKIQDFHGNRLRAAEELGTQEFFNTRKFKLMMEPVEQGFMERNPGLPKEAAKENWDRILRHSEELGGDTAAFTQAYTDVMGAAPDTSLAAMADAPLKAWAGDYKRIIDSEIDWGVRTKEHNATRTKYATRTASKDLLKYKKGGAYPTSGGLFSSASNVHREEILREIPQEYLRDMLQDKSFGGKSKYVGNNPLGGGAEIEKKYGQYLGYQTKDETGKVIDVTPTEHARELSAYLSEIDPDKVKSIHEINPVGLFEKRHADHARIISNVKAAHDALFKAQNSGGIRLQDAFEKLGLDGGQSVSKFSTLFGISHADAKNFRVDPNIVDEIVKANKFIPSKPWLDFVGKAVDGFNEIFKTGVTVPFPAFHLRNWLSGQHMNLSSGHIKTPADMARYMKSYWEAVKIRKDGLDNPLIEEATAHKVLGGKQAFEDTTLRGTSDVGPGMLGSFSEGYKQAVDRTKQADFADTVRGQLGPLGKAASIAGDSVLNSGSNIAQTLEYYNRMAMYIYLKKKGLNPRAAAKEVEKLQFDYSKLAPFERDVMRRMVPFYTFSRKITPQILDMLIDRPGGPIAQTIRASTAAREDNEVLPAHVAETAAVGLDPLPDGTKRYMTGFGLAPEAALPYLAAPTDIKGAGLEAMSALTPLLKYPLEMGSGTTFFQRGQTGGGRPLSELDPTIARTAANITGDESYVDAAKRSPAWQKFEHFMANTPLTKVLTTARGVSDPRKYKEANIAGVPDAVTNIMLPTRITNVSPQQQERLLQMASNELADRLGAGTWSNRYFSESNLEKLDKQAPELAAQARQLKELWSESKRKARKYSEKNKKKAEKSPVQSLLDAAR